MIGRLIRWIFCISVLSGCALCGAAFYLWSTDLVDFTSLERSSLSVPSVIVDELGREIARFEQDKREPIRYEKLPQSIISAFVTTEDRDFFHHPGVSIKGIVRSALVNLYYRRAVQGASTITQQLARLVFLSSERTWWRKIQEIFIALQIERQCSKEQILELYLNNIYFGRGIYGVEAAMRRFWQKSVTDVTLEQAAMLAAIAKSARFYSPLNAPLSARRRRDVVLRSMRDQKIISLQECAVAMNKKLDIVDDESGGPIRLYLQEWIRQWAERLWGRERLYRGGLKIKTTINLDVQDAAERAFTQVVGPLQKKMGDNLNGGLVAMQPQTGAIRAVVGGMDFKKSQFNRAFQAYRQIGSSFKPILYSCALKAGVPMNSVFVDEQVEVVMPNGNVWKPKNWNNKFEGPMTLARALTRSNNMIAIKLLMEVGMQSVITMARRFGLSRGLLPYPSVALGIAESTVEQNTAAFNVFANNGVYVKPVIIEWVKDAHGNKLWQAEKESYQVLSPRLASQMVSLLGLRMKMAARMHKNWINVESIGKTGSTNGAAETWFVGATPDLTTAIYIGRDDNKPLGNNVFATSTTMPMWINFYKQLQLSKKHFYRDPSLKKVAFDWITGELASNEDSNKNIVKILE
jgi:penicillin-binding protein 1A